MRYKSIAELMMTDIRQGVRAQGQRMPSLRALAQLYGVSMTTALNSYRLLEELGWIVSKPQSGFYITRPLSAQKTPDVPSFSSLPCVPNPPNRSAFDVAGVAPGPLGISQLAPCFLPTEALQRSVKRAIRRLGTKLHRYPQRQGELGLRSILASHFAHQGFPFSVRELVITHGCIDAVCLALECTTQPGDAVAISSPCFNGLLQLLASLGRKVVEIPSTQDGIDLAQLEHHLKAGTVKAGLFSTSHMNPHGASLSPAQKQQLAELAAQYRTPIIEDDVYLELSHNKAAPLPAKYWDTQGYILWCGSISKSLSAGLRVGWCLPGRYLTPYLTRQGCTQVGVSVLSQMALSDFIETGQYQQHLQKVRLTLQQQMHEYQRLAREVLPANSAISRPTGGTVLWLQVPGLDATTLLRTGHSQGLDIRIGPSFTTRSLYQDYLRINTGWPLANADGQPSPAQDQLALLGRLIQEQLQLPGAGNL